MKPKFNWPPAADEIIERLAAEKRRAVVIAAALSVEFNFPFTKNMVIGRSRRRSVTLHAKNFQPSVRRPDKVRDRSREKKRDHKKERALRQSKVKKPPTLTEKPKVKPEGYSPTFFSDRRPDQCVYPMWGSTEKIGDVCGAPKVDHPKIPYCLAHLTVCTNLEARSGSKRR